MAAKIGAALLEKNQLLEGKLALLESKLTSDEAKIEEMTSTKKKGVREIYAAKETEGHCRASSSQEYVDTETQTTPTPDQPPTNAPHTGTLFSSSALLLDIAQLKNRQEQLELMVKECTGKILDQSQAATLANNKFREASPTLERVQMTPSRSLTTTNKKNKHKVLKGKNQFSVSLQVAKSKINHQKQHNSKIEPNHKSKQPPPLKLGSLHPPENSKPRPHNETIEEFFDKNIDYYKQIITSNHQSRETITDFNSSDEEEAPFLESNTSRKGRQKTQ
ncbi:hypothetical protein J6590_072625 [Homalodisca vitripennis]|nr:hypothetical protein J6590_072625 [Homalodisca vitripennis]